MKKDELQSIWQEGNATLFGDLQTDREMITKQLNVKTLKGVQRINNNLIFYALLQLSCVVLLSMNIAGYLNNTSIIWILIPQLILSIGFLVFSMHTYYKLREINNYSDSLKALIDKQLWFYRGPYEIWQVLAALSTIILITNLNMFIDNDGGNYVIYKPWVFVGVSVGAFLFIYGSIKLTSILGLRNLKAYLADLQQGTLEESQRMEQSRKKFRWIWILAFFLLLITFVLGILAATGLR